MAKLKDSDFLVLQAMSERNLNIKASGPNLMLSAFTVKQGGRVTMGTDQQSIIDIVNDDALVVMYVVDKKQFNEIKQELKNQ